MSTAQTGIDRPAAPLTVSHQGDTGTLGVASQSSLVRRLW